MFYLASFFFLGCNKFRFWVPPCPCLCASLNPSSLLPFLALALFLASGSIDYSSNPLFLILASTYPGPDLYMQPASNSSRSQRPYPGGDPGSHFSASSAGSVDSTMTSQSAPRSSSSSSSRSQPSRSIVVSCDEKEEQKQAAPTRSIYRTPVLTLCFFSHASSPINKYPKSRRASHISW